MGILEGVATFLYNPGSAPLRRKIQRDRTARYDRWKRYGVLKRIFTGGRTAFAQEHACVDMPTVEKYVLEHPSDGGWTWI